MRNIFLVVLTLVVLIYSALHWMLNSRDPLIKWNWDAIDTSQKNFPESFVWGAASSAHQVEGGHQGINNFGRWELLKNVKGEPNIVNGDVSGDAVDHWNRVDEDTQLMADLGLNAYRFSISWSKVMPQAGVVNPEALQHYIREVETLISAGITPMVTLHHFTHPVWFEDLGGFEKEENIAHFVEFSEVVFNALQSKVKQWCTINEPAVYMFDAYLTGLFPPGKKDPVLAAQVLENLMRAHVRVYRRIKSLPGGQDSKVGLVKNMMQMDAYAQYNLMDHVIKFFDDNSYNESILRAFKTDEFDFYMPTIVTHKAKIHGASKTLDFIGLNYYSHYAFEFNGDVETSLDVKPFPGEVMTDMDYGVYPEGIYRAIKRVSQLGVPIIITENGIADDKDDRRADFIDRYLYAVSKAIEDGYNVQGYYYWSLTDNFEWNLGYGQRFGLYYVDFDTQKRTLKDGAKQYLEIIKRSKK